MVSNKKRNIKYQWLAVREEAVKEFNSCIEGRETKTDTLMKLIRIYKNNNRKCPELDRGIIESQ